MQVVYPTTPAQHFHALRRQMKNDPRKPLIVMTPKSLLRHPRATSTLNELTSGRFEPVLSDSSSGDRVVITAGKIYYDLLAAREERKANVRIIRLEQFYPFPQSMLTDAIGDAKDIVWVQEEPANMGSWGHLERAIGLRRPPHVRWEYVGRPRRASPSEGYAGAHHLEQERIVAEALGLTRALHEDGNTPSRATRTL